MINIEFNLNGKPVKVQVPPEKRLLDVLREDLNLTGTKEGCGEGECGACSILLNGKLVNSCIIAVGAVENQSIITIEGFSETKRYRILESSFLECGGVQCGFCTPGFVLAAESLLNSNPEPDENEIREALSGNICRCTGYNAIIKSVQHASSKGKGIW